MLRLLVTFVLAHVVFRSAASVPFRWRRPAARLTNQDGQDVLPTNETPDGEIERLVRSSDDVEVVRRVPERRSQKLTVEPNRSRERCNPSVSSSHLSQI